MVPANLIELPWFIDVRASTLSSGVPEEDTMDRQRIVVGYDGSKQSRRAVDWAVAEARRSHTQLQIVHTYQIPWPGTSHDAAAEQRAEQILAGIVMRVRERGTGVDVIGTTVQAAPAAMLLDLGEAGAGLLVVGNRGAGGTINLLLGSVSQQVATHAKVPVVVVRGRSAADGPVVVGVDGSPSASAALGLAFEAALVRGTGVVAIRSHVPPAMPALPLSVIEAAEREALEESLVGWREKYPTVAVEALLATGRAARVLIGVSHAAQLVVVGNRGHGGFAGLLLGSVGQQLMHHADCPVLIAHTRGPRPDSYTGDR
jgi:nucleotide-binding universal stress UspA family protein